MRRVVAWFDDYDVLVCPTVAQPPPPVGLLGPDTDYLVEVPRLFALTPFTAMWNTTGQPAIVAPAGDGRDGLPVGVQVVGRPAAEADARPRRHAGRGGPPVARPATADLLTHDQSP